MNLVQARGVALVHIGVSEHEVVKFETALKVDKFVLTMHGEASQMRGLFQNEVR